MMPSLCQFKHRRFFLVLGCAAFLHFFHFHGAVRPVSVVERAVECLVPHCVNDKGMTTDGHYEKASNTIVTAYFQIPSKHSHENYAKWMRNMLSLQDAMVIFTSPDMVDSIRNMRAHAKMSTHIVPMKLSDTKMATAYTEKFWEKQLEVDPEKAIHKTYELFLVWLSKSWFVMEAITANPFSSDVFVWSDIGCFRTNDFNGKMWLQHTEVIPDTAMLMMAYSHPSVPLAPESLWVVKAQGGLFVSGAQFAGQRRTWGAFQKAFMATIEGYVQRKLFIGEDQAVLQSTCLQNPLLCAFVTPDMVHGNVWFGLQVALHRGLDPRQIWWVKKNTGVKQGGMEATIQFLKNTSTIPFSTANSMAYPIHFITNSGGVSPILFAVRSALATAAKPVHVNIWTAPAMFQDVHSSVHAALGACCQDFFTVRVFNFSNEAQNTPFETLVITNLDEANGLVNSCWAKVARLLVAHNYGGLYVDVDVLFLKGYEKLFDIAFPGYIWGDEGSTINNAVMNWPSPKHPELVAMMNIAVSENHFGPYDCFTALREPYWVNSSVRPLPQHFFELPECDRECGLRKGCRFFEAYEGPKSAFYLDETVFGVKDGVHKIVHTHNECSAHRERPDEWPKNVDAPFYWLGSLYDKVLNRIPADRSFRVFPSGYKVLVTGTGHSSTSLVAAMFGSQSKGHTDKYHPAGIFESKTLTSLNDSIMRAHGLSMFSYKYLAWDEPSIDKELFHQVVAFLRNEDVVKDPRLVFTLPYWLRAAHRIGMRPVVVDAYRSPLCACDHPHCPNCGGDCFERVARHTSRLLEIDPIVVDMDAFYASPEATYRRLAARCESFGVNLVPLQSLNLKSRKPCASLTINQTFTFVGRRSTANVNTIRTHFRATHDMQCNHKTPSATTVVTAFWDIGREFHGDGRKTKTYTNWLQKTLHMNAATMVFSDAATIANIKLKATKFPTCYVTMPIEDHPYYARFFEDNKRIIQTDAYLSRVQDPDRVEVVNPKYNIVQWGKIELMRMAVHDYNPFRSSSVIWVDAGLSRFMPDNIPTQPFPQSTPMDASNRFVVSTNYNLDLFQRTCSPSMEWKSDSYFIGGVLLSSRAGIATFAESWELHLQDMLEEDKSANDQIALLALWCKHAHLFHVIQEKGSWHQHMGIHQAMYNPNHKYTVVNLPEKSPPKAQSPCKNKDFHPVHKTAVFTMLTDDPSYVTGAAVMGWSVKRHTSVPVDLVIMELSTKPLDQTAWDRLHSIGWTRCVVERIAPHDEKATFVRFRDQFTKIHAWGMTMYTTLLYLDSDTLVIKSIDSLLTMDIGDKAIGVSQDISAGKWLPTFNMGVFLIHPNTEEYRRLLELKKSNKVKYHVTMSEQGWLNVVYKGRYHEIGFGHNANLACYSQDRPKWDMADISIVHYTMEKPWACGRIYEDLCDIWRSYKFQQESEA